MDQISKEDILKTQASRLEVVRTRIASCNCNENKNICPCHLLVLTTSPKRRTPPRDLLKFNGKGIKWKSPLTENQHKKQTERFTYKILEATTSPLLLNLGGDDVVVVVDTSAVGRRVATFDDDGELHFGKVQQVFTLGTFGNVQYYAIKFDNGKLMICLSTNF